MRKAQTSVQGFTLLELLVVMVIIGLLASYVGPRFFEQVGKSEIKAVKAQLDAFGKALDTYRLDTGHYPTSEQGLLALVERPVNESRWSGPYLQKTVPQDPWGEAYVYKSPGDKGREYDIVSLGKDSRVGGTGEATDIGSWETAR
jgi:general secretion pathway protein G